MQRIEKVVGRAGTGKTTYLVKKILDIYKTGISPHQTAMVTFSRGAADVFTSRVMCEVSSTIDSKLFDKFGTMHSLASKLIGWRKENEYTTDKKRLFMELYYPDMCEQVYEYDEAEYRLTHQDKENLSNSSVFDAMKRVYDILENLMIYDFDFDALYIATGSKLEYNQKTITKKQFNGGYGKYVLRWANVRRTLNPRDVIEFCQNFTAFKAAHGIIDFSDVIKQCLEGRHMLDVKYMFVDEFQDFNELQFKLYEMWRDNPYVENICIAGDDAQTVHRFGGANADYFISTKTTETTKLPRTYRHGEKIFKNAQIYIDKMVNVVACDVVPSPDTEGTVVKVYGREWENHIKFGEGESVLVLAWTKEWVAQIKHKLSELVSDDMHFASLGEDKKEERVLSQYNTIARLDRGESVGWNDVRELFTGAHCLPSKMLVDEINVAFDGTKTHMVKNVSVLKSMKNVIRADTFEFLDVYNKHTFAHDFLRIEWNGRLLMNNIKNITIFDAAADTFPAPIAKLTQKRVGTIHKSKGGDADTVILFMSVPYPAVESARSTVYGRDDILHTFYVGASRAKYRLIEVYDYLYTGKYLAPAPLDVV